MKRNSGTELGAFLLLVGFIGWLLLSWPVNLYKMTQCDWSSGEDTNWKCEVIHTAGLIPSVSMITVWFGTDKKGE